MGLNLHYNKKSFLDNISNKKVTKYLHKSNKIVTFAVLKLVL